MPCVQVTSSVFCRFVVEGAPCRQLGCFLSVRPTLPSLLVPRLDLVLGPLPTSTSDDSRVTLSLFEGSGVPAPASGDPAVLPPPGCFEGADGTHSVFSRTRLVSQYLPKYLVSGEPDGTLFSDTHHCGSSLSTFRDLPRVLFGLLPPTLTPAPPDRSESFPTHTHTDVPTHVHTQTHTHVHTCGTPSK